MFKNIKDKLKLIFSGKGYRSKDNCNVEKVDENKPVEILKKQIIKEEDDGIKPIKKQPTERENDKEKLKKKLVRIVNNTKTYRIRKKNIKRLFNLVIN